MQLIIAAPENISREKGTTYKLVRKVFQEPRACARGGAARFRRRAAGAGCCGG
ncbi:hypothetical protein M8494_16190 [Serratia ureilytica]